MLCGRLLDAARLICKYGLNKCAVLLVLQWRCRHVPSTAAMATNIASRLPAAVRAVQTPSHVCSRLLPSGQPSLMASARLLSRSTGHGMLSMHKAVTRSSRAAFATVVRSHTWQTSDCLAGHANGTTLADKCCYWISTYCSCADSLSWHGLGRRPPQRRRWARRYSSTLPSVASLQGGSPLAFMVRHAHCIENGIFVLRSCGMVLRSFLPALQMALPRRQKTSGGHCRMPVVMHCGELKLTM